ncbi:hypothetical protein [Roseinatronobacter alkalisoli]|uniref:Uncharacterized protein n=1 Tax=Roseinatronobacter alkalisoli TaxID=3028235 RepID=A0ABT5TFU5_9RHOB|nr:hypothetical protein [Roseinatronobacter sp. HJB301]MDD7974006.1 hypothetical protein [Roseinatronobacter sp. HJB301]
MAPAIGKLWAVLFGSMALTMLTTSSIADISDRCKVSDDPEYVSRFKAAHRKFTDGAEIGDNPVNVLDCGYLLIIETPKPPRAFGSDAVYLFWKDGFQFIAVTLLN